MTVVYRSDLGEVHHGYALDVLAEVETESVDLVIADPPYGVEWRSGRRAELFDPIEGDTPEDRLGIRGYGPPTGRTLRHPTEKPWQLLRELIESSSTPGELVLDPFAGIGSTGVAAVLSGRRFLLIECEKKYLDVTLDRIRLVEELVKKARYA